MAGTGGYFLQGLAGGLQTGYNMRMNKMEMDWKKKEREALKKKQDEFIEVSKNVQGMITKFGEDGAYSSDEILQLNTAIMAGGIEIQQQFKDWMKSIQDGDREKVSQQKGYIDSWLNEIDGFTPENIDSVFNSVSQYVTHPEAKKYLDAQMAIKKKKAEYADPNVKTWEQAGTLPMENRPDYLRSKGIEIPQPTTTPKELTPLSAKDNWAIENYKTGKITFDQLSKYMGTLIEPEEATALEQKIAEAKRYGASNDEIKKMIVGGTGGGGEEPETVSTLKNWEQMFNIKDEEGPKTEEEYNRALDLLAQSKDKYKPKFATWKEALISEVKIMAKELEVLSKDKSTKGKENFNFALNIYMQKLEEIKTKYPEVNLSQFPEFKQPQSFWQKILERGKYSK